MKTTDNKEAPSIISYESSSERDATRHHQREIEIFTGILNCFTSGLSKIGSFEIKEDNEAEYIWLLSVARCLHSIRCAIILMLKGYYSQAMSLLRTGTEDWFICGTCKNNEDVRDYLLREKGRMPRYKTLAEQMDAVSVYEKDYGYQSKFTHSSRLGLRVLTETIAPKYDKILFMLCAESLVRVFFLMVNYMALSLQYVGEDKAKSWADNNKRILEDTEKWYKELREKYSEDNQL